MSFLGILEGGQQLKETKSLKEREAQVHTKEISNPNPIQSCSVHMTFGVTSVSEGIISTHGALSIAQLIAQLDDLCYLQRNILLCYAKHSPAQISNPIQSNPLQCSICLRRHFLQPNVSLTPTRVSPFCFKHSRITNGFVSPAITTRFRAFIRANN